MAVLQRATKKPAGSIFIFNFAAANFTMASELELMAALHHQRNGGDFGFLEGIPENRLVCVDRTPAHSTHLRSTVCSQARNAHHALGSRPTRLQNCIVIFVRLKRVHSSGLFHVSSLVVSPAFHHEHLIFLIHSSYYDTRTRSTIGTT